MSPPFLVLKKILPAYEVTLLSLAEVINELTTCKNGARDVSKGDKRDKHRYAR